MESDDCASRDTGIKIVGKEQQGLDTQKLTCAGAVENNMVDANLTNEMKLIRTECWERMLVADFKTVTRIFFPLFLYSS